MILGKEDRIISDFLDSIGPWNQYIVIGGGYAPIIYKLYLANQNLDHPPVGTRDIDSLIPRKVPNISKKSIAKHLSEANFKHTFKGLEDPPAEVYIKEIGGVEIEVEFLTDTSSRKEKFRNVPISGIVAQPLRYLSLSLEKNMKFKTHLEKSGFVVSPGAWMFHKGLTFFRRKHISKICKDLYGIWYVATQLGNFSEKGALELQEIGLENPKWLKTFQRNLNHWTEEASPSDWSNLEAQDPYGKLKQLSFEQMLREMHRLSATPLDSVL